MELIETRHFGALRAEWGALALASGGDNIFGTHSLLSRWLAHFGTPEHRLLLHRRAGRLTIGALVRTTPRGLTVERYALEVPPLVADRTERAPFGPLLDGLARRGDVDELVLYRLPATPATRRALTSAAAGRFAVLARDPESAHRIDLAQPFSAWLHSRPKKVRAELRRKACKLGRELPAAELRLLHGRAAGLAAIEEVERDGWKDQAGTAIISTDAERGFYGDLLDLPEARLYLLDSGTAPLAYALCLAHRGRLYALKSSYAAAHAALSPGVVLFHRLLEHLAGTDPTLHTLELLGSDARWKRELASRSPQLCTWQLLRTSPRRQIYAEAYRLMTARPRLHALVVRARAAAARSRRP
ncbi:MAG: GNAT family N-acetyltransferase [Myxococcota bacterium]